MNACTRRSMSRDALCEHCLSMRLRSDTNCRRARAFRTNPSLNQLRRDRHRPARLRAFNALEWGARRQPTVISCRPLFANSFNQSIPGPSHGSRRTSPTQ